MKSPLAFLLALLLAGTTSAATFVVTNTNDSGPGSLRQAIADASNTFDNQITFNIPGAGVQTISLLSPLLPTSGVTIDGYTQPGAKPNSLALGTDAVLLIEITGNKAAPSGTAFQLNQGSTIRGLIINGFATDVDVRSVRGQDAKLLGCYLETNATGSALIPPAKFYSPVSVIGAGLGAIIGGPTPADRNVIAGPVTFRQSNLGQPYTGGSVVGNYVGVSADGKSFLAPNASVAFSSFAQGVIKDNVVAGFVTLAGATGTITGNFIGTDALGTTASPEALGLDIFSFTSPAGGGVALGTVVGNVIVAVKSSAPVSLSNTAGSTLKGNLIAVAADGKTPLGNASSGIILRHASNTVIGGENSGDGNVITFSAASGEVGAGINAIGNTGHTFIEGNSISGTGGLAIDFATQGVTPNDAGDADGTQNYPVLTSARFANGTVQVIGSLNSVANTAFRIEIFGNDSADPSGYGQGQSYLGFTSIVTDAAGNASFDVTLPVPPSTRAISSTATGPNGTSEFSASLFAKLLNISTRANVQTGENIAIAGFIITGTDTKTVLLRGIGPSLKIDGVPLAGTLLNPVLDVWDSSNNLLAHNNDWKESQQSDIQQTGLAPTNVKESAVLLSLAPGTYTAQLTGFAGGTGTGLVEVYDLTELGSQLANISTRSLVQTGDNVLIAGCILAPNTGRSGRILVRGIGPSLSGISNPLPDPTIELHDGNGAVLASNDDWKTNQAEIEATGIAPGDDRESALVADVLPNGYTVVLRGKGDATGVAVVEVYRLP